MKNNYYPFINLELGYPYDSLEPYIDEKTMHIHHDKHLQTYVDNLNSALQNQPQLQRLSLEQLIKSAYLLPCKLQMEIRNNAGGVYNHRFYFSGLKKPSDKMVFGNLWQAINCKFGSFDEFKNQFSQAALSVFGSGYAWLVLFKGELRIVTTANQDSIVENNMCPILCIDVWEHAYYLKHFNQRAKYIEDWFCVIDWDKAEINYLTDKQ